tara:strand:+ start:1094 stop:1681 length:588 start_codon:yes stop_codon:yes gene_type:complete
MKNQVNYILITDSATESLTLAEVKTYLRIDGTDYDNILTPLIKTVRQLAEKITGRDFIDKTWKTYLDYFPGREGIELRKSKLQSVTSINYYNKNTLTLLNAADYYITNEVDYSSIYLIEGQSYPATDNRRQAVEITFVSGYGADADAVPQALKQAMLSHVAYLFENTGDCTDSGEAQFKQMYFPYILSQMFLGVC